VSAADLDIAGLPQRTLLPILAISSLGPCRDSSNQLQLTLRWKMKTAHRVVHSVVFLYHAVRAMAWDDIFSTESVTSIDHILAISPVLAADADQYTFRCADLQKYSPLPVPTYAHFQAGVVALLASVRFVLS
jgi:hypothetical protein